MASVSTVAAPGITRIANPVRDIKSLNSVHVVQGLSNSSLNISNPGKRRMLWPRKSGVGLSNSVLNGRQSVRSWVTRSLADDLDVIPVQSNDIVDQQEGRVFMDNESEEDLPTNQVGGWGFNAEGRFQLETAGAQVQIGSGSQVSEEEKEEEMKFIDRAINAIIVFSAGAFVITKMLTIDHDYWHGWTLYEIVRYAPVHNWTAYEEALKTNPVLAKMVISGAVYSLGDWIAQCYEGKPIFEFNRTRMFRSGLVGFSLHGSLSHYYYHLSEALFPFQDWWVVPAKVAFDQTIWAAVWNSIYFTVLGLLRFESPVNILNELKATFWPLLTAGWKLWPFAHLITYGVVPVEQRLLWVDCVELIWVTILSMYSNEKSEARLLESSSEGKSESAVNSSSDISKGQ
uniref:TSA: Wollemia nobilis Ref_Wollemi_Transcript_28563_1725 transcribed RNA sequence n=1 Tax=Wollemia nobilis TaxID=56998 RepID=A0A0C9RG78_9CONI